MAVDQSSSGRGERRRRREKVWLVAHKTGGKGARVDGRLTVKPASERASVLLSGGYRNFSPSKLTARKRLYSSSLPSPFLFPKFIAFPSPRLSLDTRNAEFAMNQVKSVSGLYSTPSGDSGELILTDRRRDGAAKTGMNFRLIT